jgi:hypothetical protein
MYRRTGNFAFALHFLPTILAGRAYYITQSRFGASAQTTQVSFEDVLVPTSKLGLALMFLLISANLWLLGTILRIFLAETKCSTLGNS